MPDLGFLRDIILLIPLSIIGLWRWSYWLVRKVGAKFYRPDVHPWPADKPRPTVTVVTPVYNEDPVVFKEALEAWKRNGVDEVVAVIDKSNTRHIINYERNYVHDKTSKTKFRMIVTPKPGKRAALCDGIEHAKGDLIALVDSDTVWDDTVLEKAIQYFEDPKIGAATVAQRISNPDTTGNVLFDILLWSRYTDEVPFLLGVGKAFNTLSGRTAFYRREAVLNPKYDNIHDLRHEFFMGTRGISGDDKRLTHLIVQQGWHTALVLGPTVYTPGLGSLRTFFKQRLRWTRNSWRADLRAVGKGWVWSHPALAFFMIDRFFQPLFMLIGPVVFTISVIKQEWLFAVILLTWWLVSRFIRIFGYFKAHPKRLIYLPAYIIYGYINALLKIYALATLIENSWATRWHKSRVKRKSITRKAITVFGGYVAIVVCTIVLVNVALSIREDVGADLRTQEVVNITELNAEVNSSVGESAAPVIPTDITTPGNVLSYVVQPGDTLNVLSERLGMSVTDLKKLNGIQDSDRISVGQTLIYYKGAL